jgi:hypothetical protein
MGKYSHIRSESVIRSMLRIALAVVLCSAPGSAFAEGAGEWLATGVNGSVSQRGADGNWRQVEQGSTLADGARVTTGPDGKLVLSRRQDTVTVSPNSDFELPRDGGPSFLQTLGTLLFRIEHTPGRRFEVDAPYLAAVVKGTVFTVSASATGNSVHVADGAVEVTTSLNHEISLVRPGQTAVVSASGRNMSIMGGRDQPRRSDGIDPGTRREAGTDHGAQAITRTLGEEHLTIRAATKGLIGDGDGASDHGRVARTVLGQPVGAAAGGDGDAAAANSNSPGANPDAAGANPNAAGGNPNAAGGNPNAAGGNPNAAGGNPNAFGGNPNAAAGNPNAAAGNAVAAANNAKGLAKH